MTNIDEIDDLLSEWEERFEQGQDSPAEELCRHRPELVTTLARQIASLKKMNWVNGDNWKASYDRGTGTPEAHVGWTTAPLQPGTQPIPGYRLEKRLGKGGFGEVWCVENLGRRYALKVIYRRPDLAIERQHAHIEKKALERIRPVSHRFILHRHTLKSDESALFVLTELADCTLDEHFQTLRKNTPKLRLYAIALSLLRNAAEALDHFQENKLTHLDIKPANLLLVHGRCKIGDFGTVRELRPGQHSQGPVVILVPALNDPDQSTTVRFRSIQDVPWGSMFFGATVFTNTGAWTPKYAPPEAYDGKFSRSFDQYSLALTFCELVAGSLPFQRSGDAQERERRSGEMNLDFLPKELWPAVSKALSPNPAQRFESCVEFIDAMRDALRPLVREDSVATNLLKEEPRPVEVPVKKHKAPAAPKPDADETEETKESWAVYGIWLALVIGLTPVRICDYLLRSVFSWLGRRRKFVGPEIEAILRIMVILALCGLAPYVLKYWTERIQPVSLPAQKETGKKSPQGPN